MKRSFLAIVGLFCLFHSAIVHAENRRHFIILQDNSGSYFQASKADITNVQESIIQLFNNSEKGDGYNLLSREAQQNITFFDPLLDEVSFLWFVADQEGNVGFYNNPDANYKTFEDYFFTTGIIPSFKGASTSIDSFLKENFKNKPRLRFSPNYSGGLSVYSFTSLAYPLCLDVIETDYSQEYIIIIVSDFKAGSTFGNKRDEKIFHDAFRQKADLVLKRASLLNGQFVTIDFCDYYHESDKVGIIGYYAFKIRPNAGLPNPENIEVRLNSNVLFDQLSYASDNYSLQESSIVFNHSSELIIDEIGIELTLPTGEKLYRDVTSSVRAKNGDYRIGRIDNLKLHNITEIKDDFSSELCFIFKTRYSLGEKDSSYVKYVFETSRSLTKSNFNLKTQLSPLQMTSIIVLILLILFLIVAAYLFFKGKPRGIQIRYNRFNDSYETIDFSSEGAGKVHTDYKYWSERDEQYGFELRVDGRFDYHTPGKFYNWGETTGYPVRVYPRIKNVPGFDIYVSSGNKASNSEDTPIEIDSFKDGVFSFVFKFRKTSSTPIEEPIKFEIGAILASTNTGTRRFELEKIMKKYEFHVGPNLGNIWLGVDPGTTGSCIAVGTSRNDVTIEQDSSGKDVISPSVIVINPEGLEDDSPASIRSNTIFGAKANAIRSEKLMQNKFVSIKKLLGYNERFEIGKGLYVKSSLLSTLLIEGLLKQLNDYITDNRLQYPQFFNSRGVFAPQRAAFAIPNNFTAAKIQQLKNCIQEVEKLSLKEIRFIYEAEAIIVNYLNSSASSEQKQESPSGETIFIFDMGGATINATLANVKKRQERNNWIYEISIISKLGYGIGGDTIDYAYLKWIFSKSDSFQSLAENDPFVNNDAFGMVQRRKLKDEVLKLKKSTISNYIAKKETLIDRIDITNFNKYKLNLVDDDTDPFIQDCKNNKSSFLYSKIFDDYVWSNIKDIISDILVICHERNVSTLDTVIMSGRSSHFPRVKEIVEGSINKCFSPKFILLGLEESKSAVARGACYYGTQSSRIRLMNMTTNGVFGVIQTLSPTSPSRFIKLIGDSEEFKDGYVFGEKSIDEGQDFIYDGRQVRFCQVMGVNPNDIIAKAEKHKYTEIATIEAQPFAIRAVQITITDKDKIQCGVTDVNGDVQPPVESVVCDSDIMACNDEQYTFFVKQS